MRLKIFKKKNEKGIALLFTLGILSLLLVLALGFATNSIMEQKIAGNNASLSQAKMLADSTINRICALLQVYDAGAISSHDEWSTDSNTTDQLQNLECDGFTWYDSYITGTPPNVSWEYYLMNAETDTGVAINKIIGRSAYVIIPGEGIDPGVLVNASEDEAFTPESRIGVDISEMNIQGIPDIRFTYGAATIQKFNDSSVAGGQYTGTWESFANIFDKIGITDKTMQDNFRKWFFIDQQKEPEAYWIDKNGDNILQNDKSDMAEYELFHRFNLARTDWDSFPPSLPADPTSTIMTAIDTSSASTDKWKSTPTTNDGQKIPWLTNFSEAGTFTSGTVRGQQITANLIDYCDSNSEPTSDSTDWTTTAPTFTGNERTFYINRVAAKGYVQFVSTIDTIFFLNIYKTIPTLIADIGVEIINIYGNSVKTGHYEVDIYGSYKFVATSMGINKEATGSFTVTIDFGNPVATNIGEKTVWDISSFTETLPQFSSLLVIPSFSTEVDINISHAILKLDTKPVDYVNVKAQTGGNVQFYSGTPATNTTSSSNNSQEFLYFSEAYDPRQNLNENDWTTSLTKVTGGDPSMPSSRQTSSKDTEPLVTSANGAGASGGVPQISTAYIRNAPMESPWELGAIHRGAAWETINLKQYDKDKGSSLNAGGGAYASGDANILDQVKMDNKVENYKINIKTHQDDILSLIYYKVYLGCDYSNPGDKTSPSLRYLEHTDITTITNDLVVLSTIADSIKAENLNFYTRAGVADVLSNDTKCGFTRANDRELEEIIGKTVNLTTASSKSEYFTVIVLAQSIRDIGNNVKINKVKSDGSVTPAYTTTTGCAFGTFDYFEDGTVPNADYYYADEIMASQKVKVYIHRDPGTRKCKILKYELLEE